MNNIIEHAENIRSLYRVIDSDNLADAFKNDIDGYRQYLLNQLENNYDIIIEGINSTIHRVEQLNYKNVKCDDFDYCETCYEELANGNCYNKKCPNNNLPI